MPYVRANGITLRYRVSGHGPPLLMVRGLVRCLDFWLDFEPVMREHFTVICFDNRGTGGSSAPARPYTTKVMADDTAALLDALGFEEVDVFGISLGGMICQQLVIRHPHKVRRLVLGCTQAGGKDGVRPPLGRIAKLLSTSARTPREANRISMPLVLSPRYLREHPEIEARWWELLQRFPVPRHVFLAQLGAALGHRARDGLRKLAIPVMCISGDEDQLIPIENTNLLGAMIPGARVEWVRGAGHDFCTEQPVEAGRILLDFLQN